MKDIENIIKDFLNKELCDGTVVYNEFSLQHELGVYLRNNLKSKKVEFERNVEYFGLTKTNFTKKEIDISIYDDRSYCAVELKFPRNGQYPESMYGFCKDIKFLEELKNYGFDKCYFVVLVDDEKFYSKINLTTSGIYKPFRTENLNQIPQLTGKIDKPTGQKNTNVTLQGTYEVQWQTFCSSNTCLSNWRYCIIEITLNKKHEISITQTACKKYER